MEAAAAGDAGAPAKRARTGGAADLGAADVEWAAPPGWGATVASAALRAYEALPHTGKPAGGGREWTLLAAFAVTPAPGAPPRVVALGTGTKCLGASARSARGDAVHDCHAEVVARRALQLWLHGQLAAAQQAQPPEACLLVRRDISDALGGFAYALRPGAALHMYISARPCGDACVCASAYGAARTGAKLAGDVPLPCGGWREAGGVAQAPGAARRKPGRGEPTLSMSCSDKMARWGALGVQGALLTHFTAAPLRITTLTVALPAAAAEAANDGIEEQAHLAALARALGGRLSAPAAALASSRWALRPPQLYAAPPPPPELRLPAAIVPGAPAAASPCGCSLSWVAASAAGEATPAEALQGTTGRRMGATRAALALAAPKTRSRLCRAAMLARFQQLAAAAGANAALQALSYGKLKLAAPAGYAAAAAALRAPPSPLAAWIAKPAGEQDFAV